MENELYSLCFFGKDNSGKEKAYEIMSMQVDKIDMYTSTWSDAKLLYHMLPSFKSKKIPCKDYLKEEFGITSDDDITIDNFFICKTSDYEYARIKNNDQIKISDSKKIPVLYRKDRDVVYLNKLPLEEKNSLPEDIRNKQDEIYMEMVKLKFISCSEFFDSFMNTYKDSESEKNIKTKKEKRLFFESVIKSAKKRNSSLLEAFDFGMIRYLKDPKYTRRNVNGLTLCLSMNKSNIKLIAEEAKRDIVLRRNLAMLIKNTKKNIDDINNKNYKTYLVSKYKLDKRQDKKEEFGFDINEIRESIKKSLPKLWKKKYDIDDDFYDISGDLTPAEKYKDASKNQRTNDFDAMDDYWGTYDLDDISGLNDDTFRQLNGISKKYER